MRRRRGIAVGVAVLVVVGMGLGVHAASSPSIKQAKGDGWRLIGTAPLSSRTDAAVAPVGKSLVVFGGTRFWNCPEGASCPFPGYRNDGAVYSQRSRTWSRMAKAPRNTFSGTWTVDGRTILFLTNQTRQRVVGYHVDTNSWSILPAPPVPLRGNDVLAAGGGFAYVADDADVGSGPLHRVERVDLATGRWDLLPRSRNHPRMYLRGLLVSPRGPLMAGLDPRRVDTRVQVEALEHRRWHRFSSPGLEADYYAFAWTGSRVVAAFPSGGGSGRSLDPKTGRWTDLAPQSGLDNGSGWWGDSLSESGPLILKRGVVFNTDSGQALVLTQPRDAGSGESVGMAERVVYVMDSASRLWWQQV